MTQTRSFAALIATARRESGMTAAEFDYSLQSDNHGLGSAAHAIGQAAGTLCLRDGRVDFAARDALLAATRDDYLAAVEAAKGKSYTGWSNASRGPIRYGA